MKRWKSIIFFFGPSLLILAFFSFPAYAQEDDLFIHPREMKFPPLSFTPPKPQRWQLANGLTLYLLEDPELPLINLAALIRSGSIYDPPQLSGLASLTATVLRTGGTTRQSPQAINEELEFMGAQLEFSMGRESAGIYLSVPQKNFRRALNILADLLINPGFDPEQIDLAKKQEIENIRRSNDDPEEIAYREFRRALYQGNPRGKIPTLESIQRIKRADLISFYRHFFKPNNTIFGLSGDFKREEILTVLEETFLRWERSLIELPLIPPPSAADNKMIFYVPKDLPQATILMGHLSLPLGHPDYIPFQVLNFILGGGGFNSRLIQEIRSNQGLAYNVGSFYQARLGYGVFGTFCQTKSSSTHRVISLIYETIDNLKKKAPQAWELDWAKKAMVNKYIFSFATAASIVRQRMQLEYDQMPSDYLEKYPQLLSAVEMSDLQRVASKYLLPEKSILLVVGKEEDFEQPLSVLGPVQKISLPKYE